MDPKTPIKTRSRQALASKAQDGDKEALEVFCRIKPPDEGAEIGIVAVGDDIVRLSYPGREDEARDHKFTRVLDPGCSQKTVFDVVALPLVADALKGILNSDPMFFFLCDLSRSSPPPSNTCLPPWTMVVLLVDDYGPLSSLQF